MHSSLLSILLLASQAASFTWVNPPPELGDVDNLADNVTYFLGQEVMLQWSTTALNASMQSLVLCQQDNTSCDQVFYMENFGSNEEGSLLSYFWTVNVTDNLSYVLANENNVFYLGLSDGTGQDTMNPYSHYFNIVENQAGLPISTSTTSTSATTAATTTSTTRSTTTASTTSTAKTTSTTKTTGSSTVTNSQSKTSATSTSIKSGSGTKETSKTSSAATIIGTASAANSSLSFSSTSSHSSSKAPIGVIIGGVVGGIAFAIILCLVYFCGRRRGWFMANRRYHDNEKLMAMGEGLYIYPVGPPKGVAAARHTKPTRNHGPSHACTTMPPRASGKKIQYSRAGIAIKPHAKPTFAACGKGTTPGRKKKPGVK